MIRICFLIALSWALSGCAADVSKYKPYIPDVADGAALIADEGDCLQYALAYKPGLDLAEIANQAGQGAASNAAGAAINPLVPLAGAAGGAGTALLQQLGFLSTAQRRVFLICLHDRGERSGKYHVMDPNL